MDTYIMSNPFSENINYFLLMLALTYSYTLTGKLGTYFKKTLNISSFLSGTEHDQEQNFSDPRHYVLYTAA
jgi:hypothetical protein